MRCGHCGWPMHGCALTYGYKDKRYFYQRYICGNYNLHGSTACQCNTVLERVLFGILARKLQQTFQDPERQKLLKAELRRLLEADAKGPQTDLKALTARIEELSQQIDQG